MSLVKIADLPDAPEEGRGKTIHLEHPFTYLKYDIGLFQVEGRYYAITDECKKCGGSLGRGRLMGLFAICRNQECAWNIKKGYCKFDRTTVLPTYRVNVQEDGLYINI
ncbi:MAG: Rieske (2Fe-2S) protein [Nitrospinaceae bacterium]